MHYVVARIFVLHLPEHRQDQNSVYFIAHNQAVHTWAIDPLPLPGTHSNDDVV